MPDSISSDDFAILMRVAESSKNGKTHRFFEVLQPFNEVKLRLDLSTPLSAEELHARLNFLVSNKLLRAKFYKKVLACPKCGKSLLNPRTACPSCRSEDIARYSVFIHGCGALIAENLAQGLATCPKCRDSLDETSLVAAGFRFVCSSCGNIFTDPAPLAECPSCGWLDEIKNADQLILREYELTDEGLNLVESADPVKMLVRKLIAEGFEVREKVQVAGLSGATHVLDVVAANRDKTETRIYMVKYKVTSLDIISWAVKRFDIEKTKVDGVVGRVRWFIAGVDMEDAASKTGETFGIETAKI